MTSGMDRWTSSWEVVNDLLGPDAVPDGEAFYLCNDADGAGVFGAIDGPFHWVLAAGMTRARARTILKVLWLAKSVGKAP